MDVLSRLAKEQKVLIYGQEDYIARVESYLDDVFPDIQKKCFSFPLTADKSDSTNFKFDLFDDELRSISSVTVIVAFSNKFHRIASEHLKRCGFAKFIYYDATLDNTLKKRFFSIYFNRIGREFIMLDELPNEHSPVNKCLKVYQAKSIYDKTIVGPPDSISQYVISIQVGAALTEKRIAAFTDATGDNISVRNRRYSEMTAFYWMWKNDKTADYLGICHYRRLWVDLDKIAERLQRIDIDAVLPLPTLCEHSVHEDYLLKHIPTVWQPMMEVMKKRSSEYYDAAKEIFRGRIFYASNMCILRREVLNDLCEWMFPIVMDVEKIVGDIEDTYYNRYAGFCTERLITLYFLYNKKNWKIAHAEKVFIG